MHKIKTLVLSTYDYPYVGHGAHAVGELNAAGFDARLVSLYSPSGNKDAIFPGFVLGKIDGITTRLFNWLHLGVFCLVVKGTSHGFSESSSPVTAKQILRKYGDKPDLICLYWIDRFISAKVLSDLKRLTNSKIVLVCVDQYMIAGGCHYLVDCEKWKSGCHNCPALPEGYDRAAKVLKERKELLSGIVDYVIGTPSDCSLAKSTELYADSTMIHYVATPDMDNSITKESARKKWNVNYDDFVIMYATASLRETRKGLVYFRDALLDISSRHPHRKITVMMPGKGNMDMQGLDNIEIRSLGFINFQQLTEIFRASDVFVSTTIADSGPMMVNFSIAAGRPVVSFPVGVAQDLVVPDTTGYLAKYKDSFDVAKGIMAYYSKDQEELDKVEKSCFSLMEKFRKTPSSYKVLFDMMQKK